MDQATDFFIGKIFGKRIYRKININQKRKLKEKIVIQKQFFIHFLLIKERRNITKTLNIDI